MKFDSEESPFNLSAMTLLSAVVALAIGTRILFAVLTTSWAFPPAKNYWAFGHEMGQIAASLAMGNGFVWPEKVPYEGIYSPGKPTAWMPPVYPFVMAGAFKAFGIFTEHAAMALELLQTMLAALTCIALYFLGKRLYDERVGLVAAFLFAVYPAAIHFAVQKTWSTSLFTGCLLFVLLMLMACADRPRIKNGMALGAMLGFTTLVDPVIVAAYPFALAWLYLKAQADRSSTNKMMVGLFIALFLTLSPWLIRNYRVLGQFTFVKSNLGNELFKGNNENATGHFKLRRSPLTEAEIQQLRQSDEATRNRFLFGKALAYIKTHPVRFAALTMKRFIYFWTFAEKSVRKIWIPLLAYAGVLCLAIAGIILSFGKGRDFQLVLLFLLALPLPYYFTVVGLLRYRFPIEPLLIVFAAYALQRLARRLTKRIPQRLRSVKAAVAKSDPGITQSGHLFVV